MLDYCIQGTVRRPVSLAEAIQGCPAYDPSPVNDSGGMMGPQAESACSNE